VDHERTIVHMDLDAFFASVEQLDRPELRGRPVIVGGTSGRGVVCAASYEARKFGVRSAIPMARALRLCPEGVFLPPRFHRYSELSERVFAIFGRYTPLVEGLSLDEAFLDVTASRALHGAGADIARAIKRAVRSECGLAVSAGIADVKFAAKIATDLGKPDGLVEVPPGGTARFLEPLPIGRLWGVGPVTERALRRIGAQTIGDLARLPGAAIAAAVGASAAAHLKALAVGDDPREVSPGEEAKSVGAEDTFETDLAGREALSREVLSQAVRVGRRMRDAGVEGDVVTLKIKYADFTLVTRRTTLAAPTDDDRTIFLAARGQLDRIEVERPIRLTGVSVSGLVPAGAAAAPPAGQLGLFAAPPPADPAAARRRQLNAAVDALREKFGDGAVGPADLAGRRRRR
jgi:DNA polymerase-4